MTFRIIHESCIELTEKGQELHGAAEKIPGAKTQPLSRQYVVKDRLFLRVLRRVSTAAATSPRLAARCCRCCFILVIQRKGETRRLRWRSIERCRSVWNRRVLVARDSGEVSSNDGADHWGFQCKSSAVQREAAWRNFMPLFTDRGSCNCSVPGLTNAFFSRLSCTRKLRKVK